MTASSPSPLSTPRPLVLVPACHKSIAGGDYQAVGRKYLEAVALAGCQAVMVPGGGLADLEALLELADGVLLTGSPSNVHPRHFGQAVLDPALPLDEDRDAWTLRWIPEIVRRGLPLLAICRGLQEVNVALGGSLHQAVHAQPGVDDHRAPDGAPDDVVYGERHDVHVQPGGVLAAVLDQPVARVNSIHGQAIDRLAAPLRAEALSPDGVIEACSVRDAAGFTLCLQWHPEWRAAGNPVSMKLLRAFGDACRTWRDKYRGPEPRQRSR